MPTPEFVLSLREHVGQDLLWLSGVTAVVLDDDGRVLLGRRADTGEWALPSGILEPGEQPAAGLVREVAEETCVDVSVESLVSVWTQPEVHYPNGDRSQYLDLCFLCRHVGGEPAVGDGELTEVAWFAPDQLPAGVRPTARAKLVRALVNDGQAWFEGAVSSGADRPAEATESRPLTRTDDGVTLRRAREDDLAAIVRLIGDDQLGATREGPGDLGAYQRAFAAIDRDPAQLLVVAEADGQVVGTFQLSFIPGLARAGALRAQVEAVRVAASHRGQRLGEAMLRWAIDEAHRRGCALVQLTSDKSREGAHRFYERLGFRASHEGFKLMLDPRPAKEEHR